MSPAKRNPRTRIFKQDKWHTCYLHFLESLSNTLTRNQYDCTLRRFFAYLEQRDSKPCSPEKVTNHDIDDFLKQPTQAPSHHPGEPLSPYSRNAYIRHLRAFYAFSAQELVEFRGNLVPLFRGINPTARVKLAKIEPVDRDMEEEEVKAFFAQIDRSKPAGARDYALFLTLLCTGRRRKEIVLLRRGDFEQAVFLESNRPRTGWIYHYLAKRRQTKESAEMPEQCMQAIRAWCEMMEKPFETLPVDHPIFFSVQSQEPLQPLALPHVDLRFKAYARAAGIPENVCCHSLRHESAWQRYCLNGHDILDVQEAMGWASADMAVHYISRRKRKVKGDPTAAALAAKFAHI